MLVVSGKVCKTVRQFDWQRKVELSQPAGHQGAVTSVAISNAGETIATAGSDRRICFWAADSGEIAKTVKLGSGAGALSAALFSPDGAVMAGITDGELRLWSMDGRREIRRIH